MTHKPYCTGDFPYRRVEDIERANERIGNHYFEASTMRFFNSRVLDGVYGGRYFITSERCDWGGDHKRLYTVREALPSGKIETVGEFQGFTSAAAARRYAQSIAPDHSVYFARLVVWANEHAGGDWRRAADHCGCSLVGPGASRAERIGARADRAELRRMFRKYTRECVTLP